jgi:ADP-ribosylglycohydrolase
MLGAIAGDICGAPWEGGACPKERFTVFGFGAAFTDDTVCTIAVAQALLEQSDIAATLRSWVNRYPNRGYGGRFIDWAQSDMGPYDSFANGGAMRVSPVALLAASLDEVDALADATAEVTHNHPEGMRGARALAGAVWLARQGLDAGALRAQLSERYGYNLSTTVAALAADFGFTVLAEETVPMAIICALEATSWEDAVANAVAIGGDADTLACMAGAIAEARFGLPAHHAQAALQYLTTEMVDVLGALYARAGVAVPWEQAETPAEVAPNQAPQRTLTDMAKAWWKGRKAV